MRAESIEVLAETGLIIILLYGICIASAFVQS